MDGGGKEHLAALHGRMGSKQRPRKQTGLGQESSSGTPILWTSTQQELLFNFKQAACVSGCLVQAQSGALPQHTPTGKEARRLACWRKPYLAGEVCSSMAPSVQSHCMRSHSGVDPSGVNREVHRSELSDRLPGMVHGSLPKPSGWRQSPCGRVNRANVRGQPTPTRLHHV